MIRIVSLRTNTNLISLNSRNLARRVDRKVQNSTMQGCFGKSTHEENSEQVLHEQSGNGWRLSTAANRIAEYHQIILQGQKLAHVDKQVTS